MPAPPRGGRISSIDAVKLWEDGQGAFVDASIVRRGHDTAPTAPVPRALRCTGNNFAQKYTERSHKIWSPTI